VAWLASTEPPSWLERAARVARATSAAELLARFEANAAIGELPRADAAVVDDAAQIDEVIRPTPGSELSPVRPCGDIALLDTTDPGASPLLAAITGRDLRLSGSRCGDFRRALDLVRGDPELLALGERLVTHRFTVDEIRRAFETARTPECIKAVIEHSAAGDEG